jgi:O-antigen/teichoic acid export membrane protein
MLKSQILKGTSWLLAGRLVSNLLGLASTLIAARLLMPEDFGLMAIAMSVFGIASAAVELPVGAALVQMKTATKADFDTAWTINVLRGVIVSVLMVLAAWPAAMIVGDDRLILLVAALAAYPLITGLRNSWFEQYIRDMDFRREALLDVVMKVASLAVTVWIAMETRSYWALPAGVVGAALAGTAASYVLRPQLPAFSLASFRKFFGFSIWIGLGSIADSFRDATTTFFLGRLLGNAKLGAFALGSQFGERLELVLYTPMERTLFAAFSSIQEDAARVRAAYLRSIHIGFAIILPVCAGIGLLAPEIISVALGPNWSLAALVLAFMAPITAVYLIAGLSNALANALGHPRALFKFKLISALMNVPAVALGILSFGLVGALWACAFTAAVWYLFSIHVAARITGLTRRAQVSAIARSAVSGFVMALVVVGVRGAFFSGSDDGLIENLLRAASLAAIGALTYAAAHFALWQVSGRPDGIERALLAFAGRRLRRP